MNKISNIFLLLVVGTAFSNPVLGDFSRSHQSTIESNKEDACSNVHSDPGGGKESKYKLKEVMNDEGELRLCCGCDPGYKLIQACSFGLYNTTVCGECEDNFYTSDYAHVRTECIPVTHTVCQQNEVFIPSSKTRDSSCECMDGYFKRNGGKCQRHSRCPPGQGVHRKGDSTHDTECKKCRPGKISPHYSSTQRCRFSSEVLNHIHNRHLKTTTEKSSDSLIPFNASIVGIKIFAANSTTTPINNSNLHNGIMIHEPPVPSLFEKYSTSIIVGVVFAVLFLIVCFGRKAWKRVRLQKRVVDLSKMESGETNTLLTTTSMNNLTENKLMHEKY